MARTGTALMDVRSNQSPGASGKANNPGTNYRVGTVGVSDKLAASDGHWG